MSFVNLCLTESLCRLSVARLARWFILILQYKEDAILTRSGFEQVVVQLWEQCLTSTVFQYLSDNGNMSIWYNNMLYHIPGEVCRKLFSKFSESNALIPCTQQLSRQMVLPNLHDIKRMKGCTVDEERASAQGMQVCLSFSFLTTKPAM